MNLLAIQNQIENLQRLGQGILPCRLQKGKGGKNMPQEKIVFPDVVEQPVMWGYHRNQHYADKHKAIVDSSTGKLFSIVSKGYFLTHLAVSVIT